jgi:transposase-like protein
MIVFTWKFGGRVNTSGQTTSMVRRRHSAEFKAHATAACLQPGVSIAAVALSLGLHANLLRRWIERYLHRCGTVRETRRPVW